MLKVGHLKISREVHGHGGRTLVNAKAFGIRREYGLVLPGILKMLLSALLCMGLEKLSCILETVGKMELLLYTKKKVIVGILSKLHLLIVQMWPK